MLHANSTMYAPYSRNDHPAKNRSIVPVPRNTSTPTASSSPTAPTQPGIPKVSARNVPPADPITARISRTAVRYPIS